MSLLVTTLQYTVQTVNISQLETHSDGGGTTVLRVLAGGDIRMTISRNNLGLKHNNNTDTFNKEDSEAGRFSENKRYNNNTILPPLNKASFL